MPINEYLPPTVTDFRRGRPDADTATDQSMAFMSELGYRFKDSKNNAADTISKQFFRIGDLGYDGRLLIVPSREVSTRRLIEIAASDHHQGRVLKSLAEYAGADRNVPKLPVAKLITISAKPEQNISPLLHHVGEALDDYGVDDGLKKKYRKNEREFKRRDTDIDGMSYKLGKVSLRDILSLQIIDSMFGGDEANENQFNSGKVVVPMSAPNIVVLGEALPELQYYEAKKKDAVEGRGIGIYIAAKK